MAERTETFNNTLNPEVPNLKWKLENNDGATKVEVNEITPGETGHSTVIAYFEN